jgi:carbon monoxide dehydrogenase subunit G
MTVTDVLATTRTKVEMSESPVSLHYAVTATGSGGAGTSAQGHIAADFSAEVEDGALLSSILFDVLLGEPPLGSKLTHYEKSTANGEWEFSKEMGYESRIRP